MRHKQEFAEKGFWESSEPFWEPLSVAKQSRRSQCSCWLHWAAAPALGLFTSGFWRGTNMYLFEQLCGVFLPASQSITYWCKGLTVPRAALVRGALSQFREATRVTSASLSALLFCSICLHVSCPGPTQTCLAYIVPERPTQDPSAWQITPQWVST